MNRYISLCICIFTFSVPSLKGDMLVEHRVRPTTHEGVQHHPIMVHTHGNALEFEDGSRWLINAKDRYKVTYGAWMPGDTIIVKNGHLFSPFPFLIINYNTCDGTSEIEVKLDKGPTPDGYYSLYLADIDYFNYEVYLSDGSTWEISKKDHAILDQWVIGQYVIVGIYEAWFSDYQNMLINPRTGEYVRSNCKA